MKPQIIAEHEDIVIFKVDEDTPEVFMMEATYLAEDIRRCESREEILELMDYYGAFDAGEMKGNIFIPYCVNHRYSGLSLSDAFDMTTGQCIDLRKQSF